MYCMATKLASRAGKLLKNAAYLDRPYQRQVIRLAGHNLPKEAPDAFADAVLELVRATK